VQAAQDPFARVLELDSSRFRRGITIGILGALLVHVAGATEAARLANGLGGWARETRYSLQAYFSRLYDIEMVNAPPPPPPPPEEPPPEPEAPKPVAAAKAPHEQHEPAPAPAQAGKILTQEPDPDAPVDLTGQGFVTGNAESYAGGVTASTGTSKTAVRNLNATPGGAPGGTGTKPGPAVTGPDLSRPASISGGTDWNCPFPPEADADQIDLQKVPVAIVVRADGSPESVRVTSDPGHGFGRAARACAMRQHFEPALNREGRAVVTTLLVNVKFTR
jgi:periplasmic protein TonB